MKYSSEIAQGRIISFIPNIKKFCTIFVFLVKKSSVKALKQARASKLSQLKNKQIALTKNVYILTTT